MLPALALLGSGVLLGLAVLLGPPGLVVGCVVIAGAALFVVRARLGWPAREAAPDEADPDPLRPYPTYRQIDFALDAGLRSAPLFGRALRPRLTRLAAAVLVERRGVDLHRDPAAAREILGDDAWNVLSGTSRPAVSTSSTSNADDRGRRARDVALVLDRLEEL